MSRYRPLQGRKLLAIAFAVSCLASTANANRAAIAAICDSAAALASRESGVPIDVLRAISLTETGRKSDGRFTPWPWTVNMEGIGKWFDDVSSAQEYVDRHFARGARSFDVGCFQINYRWHGQAFSSIEDMFDPITNARYAARFLGELYQEFGDWSKAAGAYHSRTPKYARKYTSRFNRIRANLPESIETVQTSVAQLPPEPSRQPQSRVNRYPFLIAAEASRGASLVPLNAQGAPLIGSRTTSPFLGSR